MGGDTAWQAAYEDPLRCRPDGSAQELKLHGQPQVEEVNNDLCTVRMVMMHRPTHETARDKTGEYPFSWHLAARRRLWELRLQVRFQRAPEGKMYFGIELDRFVPVSGVARQAQKALVSACQRVVGDCYHTTGDDPAKVQGEPEAPAFVMPLWAFDQFHVANPGEEPSLLADLEGVGLRRSDGASKYISAMRAAIGSFSTDKVYTFCFWGVSKFLDIMRWEVVGGLMPVKLDFNRLCGTPPVYLTIYELPGVGEQDKDKRHLASRKRQYFRAAVWSALKPPGVPAAPPPPEEETASLDYWTGLTGFEGEQGGEAPGVVGSLDDFLGLDDPSPSAAAPAASAAAPAPPAQPAAKTENVDLLGLF